MHIAYRIGEPTGVFSKFRLGDAGAERAFATLDKCLFSLGVFLYKVDIKLFTALVSYIKET